MNTPECENDELDESSTESAMNEAIWRVHDISEWFRHVQDVTPRLHRLRIAAIRHLRLSGLTKPEIANICGLSEHRVNEIIKNDREGAALYKAKAAAEK